MSWQQQQEQFWQWISRPQDLGAQEEAIESLLAPHSHLGSAEALAIYHNAFHMRLLQVSSEMLPVVYHTLGEDAYRAMFLGYLEQHLPRPGPMHLMLEDLEAWLRSHPVFGKLPALLDIVHVEIMLTRLFDVGDEPALTLPRLQSLPAEQWGNMRLRPKQDWALFASRFDLAAYWRQMSTWYSEGGAAGAADFGVPLNDPGQPETLQDFLLMRHHHRMQIRPIAPALHCFLKQIRESDEAEGISFATLCERLATSFPDRETASFSLQLLLQALSLELLHA